MSRLAPVDELLSIRGPYSDVPDDFTAEDAKAGLSLKVLVIGAGGLGCEIIKDLALTGFTLIDVIDMDTIDVSNLNRQFLFRDGDVGKSKALVACAAVAKVIGATVGKGTNAEEVTPLSTTKLDAVITPHYCKIQDKSIEWYKQFQLVICGLDSVEARRWINATLQGLDDVIIPMIDGGTEGFRGQARVIIPGESLCYECTLDMVTPKVTYPVCTIANTPRLPEHCIEWALVIAWPRQFGDRKFDGDNPTDVDWMYATAAERARQFDIRGVTRLLTLGVVKNIIPAIASTNAVIAAACCNEAFKIVTNCNPMLNNYMMYSGDELIFTYTFPVGRRASCLVCGQATKTVKCPALWTLDQFIEFLLTQPDIQVQRPSLATKVKNLYFQSPPTMEELTRPNLYKEIGQLIEQGEELVVTDPSLPINLKMVVEFTKDTIV